jgi:hypothetical protein
VLPTIRRADVSIVTGDQAIVLTPPATAERHASGWCPAFAAAS